MGKDKRIPARPCGSKPTPVSTFSSTKAPVSYGWQTAEHLCFSFEYADDTHWPIAAVAHQHTPRLMKQLKYFSKLTVDQAKRNHMLADYDVQECPNRTVATHLHAIFPGQDSLCRLTVQPSGSLRLMGVREGHMFFVLWWDPAHEIWPEGKTFR